VRRGEVWWASLVRLADAPGNILLERRQSRLPRDSVINVSQVLTIDKGFLTDHLWRWEQEESFASEIRIEGDRLL
jgi:mRNA-degrading endonuclease toxin of MazEF toxin-antitoxin module